MFQNYRPKKILKLIPMNRISNIVGFSKVAVKGLFRSSSSVFLSLFKGHVFVNSFSPEFFGIFFNSHNYHITFETRKQLSNFSSPRSKPLYTLKIVTRNFPPRCFQWSVSTTLSYRGKVVGKLKTTHSCF